MIACFCFRLSPNPSPKERGRKQGRFIIYIDAKLITQIKNVISINANEITMRFRAFGFVKGLS